MRVYSCLEFVEGFSCFSVLSLFQCFLSYVSILHLFCLLGLPCLRSSRSKYNASAIKYLLGFFQCFYLKVKVQRLEFFCKHLILEILFLQNCSIIAGKPHAVRVVVREQEAVR